MFLAVGSEELTDKVSAGANYLGTFFSSAWSKTTKTANDATTSSSSFLTSAFGKVGGSTANSSTGKYRALKSISDQELCTIGEIYC